MKNILTCCLALVIGVPTLLPAQLLLPQPQSVCWQKGHFRLDQPYCVVNDVGSAAITPYSILPSAQTGQRTVCYKHWTSKRSKSTENYRLLVTPDSIVIGAADRLGFLRATQTLQQLATKEGIRCCTIEDYPEYAWRGVMIDVSRHFFPLHVLQKQVDILAQYKINRLHLHLTDAAGWRMEIQRYPRLNTIGAWRTDSLWKTWWNNGKRHYATATTPGAYGGYYTQDELRQLVNYAAERGITIVPEIEMPAHSEEVLSAYPELSCTHEPYKQADFCPGSVATYDFLEHVLEEVMAVFPSIDIHVGGDEAGKASWGKCPLCRKKMQEEGIATVDGLQTYLIRHIGAFLAQHGRRLVGWDEIVDADLGGKPTVMVWRDLSYATAAAAHGYDILLSPGKYYYFDSYQDAPPTQPEAIGGYLPLEQVYGFAPAQELPADVQPHIRGVQANVWTEYISTPSHLEYMLYPRVLALAETGWYGSAHKNYPDFRQRVLAHSDRLRKQNVTVFDIQKEKGEREVARKLKRHKGMGAKVCYALPPHTAYKAAGEGALTDGVRGGWAHYDGRWQGFIRDKRLDVTLDLGKVQRIRRVATDFLQVCGPEIFYPSAYIISVSRDGKSYKELYRELIPSTKTIQPDVRTCQWQGKSIAARYIRVQALPSEFGGWVFTDEIVVE